jgi:hypothetical protein
MYAIWIETPNGGFWAMKKSSDEDGDDFPTLFWFDTEVEATKLAGIWQAVCRNRKYIVKRIL